MKITPALICLRFPFISLPSLFVFTLEKIKKKQANVIGCQQLAILTDILLMLKEQSCFFVVT